MKIRKLKVLSIVVVMLMFTTFAGFKFYAESKASNSEVEMLGGIAKVLGESIEMTNTGTIEETTQEVMTQEDTTQENGEVQEIALISSTVGEENSLINSLIIADVSNFVNIRDQANEEGEIVGKLYDKSVGTLLEVSGDWFYIESGSVRGYVKTEYVLTGDEAIARANEVGTRLAKVITTTLNVRDAATTDSEVLGLVPEGDILSVKEEVEGWIKVSIEEGEGYVSTDYLNVYTQNVEAESIKEEQIRLEKEETEQKKAEEAAKRAVKEKEEAAQKAANEASSSVKKSTTASASSTTTSNITSNTISSGNTALGQQIANFGLQFVGNPYVYGGTSLTDGADCSGFVMGVYSHFGVSLPRTSGEQGCSGKNVGGIENAQAGDLVWYSGHIGIYIGNGKVVHASNQKEGIKVSDATYRTILGVRRIV